MIMILRIITLSFGEKLRIREVKSFAQDDIIRKRQN